MTMPTSTRVGGDPQTPIRQEAPRPVAVVGGNGYVAGEVARLLAEHPALRLVRMASTSRMGESVTATFPHLGGSRLEGLGFSSLEDVEADVAAGALAGVFLATPHGAAAPIAERLLAAADAAGTSVHLVDLSADFRFADPARYERVYKAPHAAPATLARFACGIPDLEAGVPAAHVAHPGCFTTAVTLGAAPFVALGLVEPSVFASAVTGSSGSGRTPGAGTHHPERRSTLLAYSPLGHRHEPEMRLLLGRLRGGDEPDVRFVPHSGPFVRGIHATLSMRLAPDAPTDAAELIARVAAFYAHSPFVTVTAKPPALTEVVGTNRARLGLATRGRDLVVLSTLDNLVKGAAGGGVQWMNRLLGLPEDAGLRLPGLGWL